MPATKEVYHPCWVCTANRALASLPVTPPTSPNRSDFHLVSTPSRLRPVQHSHMHSARGRYRCCGDWSLNTYGERFLRKGTQSYEYMSRHRASEEVPASECLDAHTSWLPGRCSSAHPALMHDAWCARDQRLWETFISHFRGSISLSVKWSQQYLI